LGIDNTTVTRAWRQYGVQPWRGETFKASTDPELVAQVTDVVALYLARPRSAPWLNLVEVWFSIIERQATRRETFASVKDSILRSGSTSPAGMTAATLRLDQNRPPDRQEDQLSKTGSNTRQ